MGDVWPQLLLVFVLIIANAAFAGSEMALVSLRDAQVARLATRGKAGAALARLAGDQNRFLSTIQVGITLAGFLASATAAVALAEPLVPLLEPLVGGGARALSVVLVTAVLTYLTLVIGELAPKRVALQRGERWALLAARPLAVLSKISAPAVWLLAASTDLIVRLFGVDPDASRAAMTEEELRDVVATQQGLAGAQRTIIAGALDLADRVVRQVLVPRTDVIGLPSDLDVASARERLVAAGHSRAPVTGRDLDDIVGVVHLRDLVVPAGPTVRDCARPAPIMTEYATVLDALRRMQGERAHLAVVVDEHGATAGIVTIEDLLEELVGEIYDEFDRDSADIIPEDDGTFVLDGAFGVHDLPDLGLWLPAGDYATVAGFVLERVGAVPPPGTRVEADGVEVEVLEADERRIEKVRVRRLTPP